MLDFLQKPKEQKDNFWALLIEPEWISSAVWQITDGKVEIISSSPATRWENDLIEPIDASLSSCMQNLPEDVSDPTKTVFGVPNSWIDGGNIKEEYLEKLKKICEDLSLTPSGFVVLSEAISHYIKQDEGAPLSGVVIGISDESLDVSIFSAGKLSGTTTVLRSISMEEDVIEGISRMSGGLENLPSRIILFNQKEQELEEIRGILDNTDWNKINGPKFIHTPKIEILDPNKKILAVALAGGSEMGEVNGVVENIQEPETATEKLPLEEVDNIEEPEGLTAEDLGFVQEPINTVGNSNEVIVPPPHITMPTLPKFNFKKPNIKFPKFNMSLGTKPLIMGGALILTLLIVGFVLWWFLPKATVTVYVSPKKLEENITISLGKDINGESVDVEVSGEKTESTTGTKVVGDKAKGQVKIQNGTDFPINLSAGTVLVSTSDLKFVTTKSASISGALSPSTPGVATIDVEASSIGSEFNLGKDEVFKVANYPKSEVDATSTDPFSGGSSRQISAVSEDDKKKISKELTEELVSEAKQKLSGKVDSNKIIIDSSIKQEVTEEDYSNKVGDEATSIKLSLSLKISAIVVSKSELASISKKDLQEKVPAGFVLRDDQIMYDFGESGSDSEFDVKITANLLPSVDTTTIAKQIVGKYPQLAEEFLGSVPGFTGAEIRLNPSLKGRLGTLPHIYKNITVEVAAQR
jgi:hypothetical protein